MDNTKKESNENKNSLKKIKNFLSKYVPIADYWCYGLYLVVVIVIIIIIINIVITGITYEHDKIEESIIKYNCTIISDNFGIQGKRSVKAITDDGQEIIITLESDSDYIFNKNDSILIQYSPYTKHNYLDDDYYIRIFVRVYNKINDDCTNLDYENIGYYNYIPVYEND